MASSKTNKKAGGASKPGSSKSKKTDPPSAKSPVGKTTGVGVSESWIRVFEQNEQKDEGDRLTDEQISELMKSEFPDLDSIAFDRVAIARGKYNRGGFHKKDKSGQVVRPKVQSTSHDFADEADAGAKNPSRSDTAPMQSRVVAQKKDFKSHKK